jgi:RNA polymerase sigma factor (sigma-70 family)
LTEAAVAHGGATAPDGVLVQEAAAGSGESYGALYDRYATQVFNYSLRLTGSPDDAADATQEAFVNVLRRLQEDDRPVLDFSSYLFAAARHESYALMRQRARTHPTDSPPEERGRVADVEVDPERAAMLRDTQEAVQEANARLAPRHREVLALREVAGRSYDEVGEIMGISPNAAAQLIWRARAKLREALTAGAVASVVATTEDCEWAQQLLSMVQDDEAVREEDREWLAEHLEDCGSCQTANRMLLEASASYRMWVPVALLAGMRSDTLTAAGGVIGADWSHVAAPQVAGSSSSGGVIAAAGAVIVAAGIAFLALAGDDKVAKVSSPSQPAVDAPAVPAKSAPARPDRAKSAVAETMLVAARAPRAAPAVAKPPPRLERADAPAAPQTPRAPEPRPAPKPKLKPPPAPAPAQPAPAQPAPAQPAPPQSSACTWPGKGNGPGGCPPGHGGTPPGHSSTPRGHRSTAPGHSSTPPGHNGTPPGHGGTPPGHAR